MSGFDHKQFLTSLTTRSGVYQMLAEDGTPLYVGKAKNLKNRVTSYFRASGLSAKTMAMVAKIHAIQVTVTRTETEALLLEHNLIKQYLPPYNILLRDDKSYPYIHMSAHEFPRISLHRGARKGKGDYFGPFPSAGAVRESIHFMQRVFQVRPCEDSVFRNRSRPCLQHQIGRCTAPCVGRVTPENYAEQIAHAGLFLKGKSRELMTELADAMESASQALEFERAGQIRDQISYLQKVQAEQSIEGVRGDLDIVCAALDGGRCCVQVLFVRAGRILGSRSFYPSLRLANNREEVVAAFIGQHYFEGATPPREIIVNALPEDADVLAEVLSERAERTVKLSHRVRSDKARWLSLAEQTAEENLRSLLAANDSYTERLSLLQKELQLNAPPARMECFDISHSQGEATVASCVVFDDTGPRKSDYRKFNISNITPGDDYAAMHQALGRRYKRLKSGEGYMPDVLFIDGGPGQVTQARDVLTELEITGVEIVGVAKGEGRKPGLETLIMASTGERVQLEASSPALHLVQQIRDEAHRFAISAHRAKRGKQRTRSALEDIPGVGSKRRRELLRFFGGVAGVQGASVEELCKVPTINEKLAATIYETLHSA